MQSLHARPLEGSAYLSAFQAAWDINVGKLTFDHQPIEVRHFVENTAHLQQLRWQHNHPGVAYQPALTLNGPDCSLSGDENHLYVACVHLLNNAFEYSDGAVHIEWRQHENSVLIAFLDQGFMGWGLTEERAVELSHRWQCDEAGSEHEGSLFWIQAIIAAHGGELFIEGYQEGVPISNSFSTATLPYPSLLNCHFRTAFIVVLPLEQGTAPGGEAS